MENFQNAVAAIAQALPLWEKEGLNEAQTCQAIILRLLKAAGYDIWNPCEVYPQYRSKPNIIPDFVICLGNKPKFIIEAKLLGSELDSKEKDQAAHYAFSLDLRWAILTNGKQWIFLDNSVVAAKRAVLVLNLTEPRAGEFLSTLLKPQLWKEDDVNHSIAKQVQVISLTMEVSKNFPNQEGVELAIHHALHPKDNSVATSNPSQVAEPFFPKNTLPVEIPAAPITQVTPQATEELLNVWQVLSINLKKLESSSSRKYTLMFKEHTINFATLPDIIVAVAETCLTCKTEQPLVFVAETDKYSKRLLSNQQYISVHGGGFKYAIRLIRKCFKALELPESSVTISSNDNGIHVLP